MVPLVSPLRAYFPHLLALLLVSWVTESQTSLAAVPPVDKGILPCLTVSLTLSNDSFTQLHTTVGLENTCPVDVSAPIWQIRGQTSCGGETTTQPDSEGQTQTPLVKSHMYTIVNADYNITCILNGAPAYWTVDVSATVEGNTLHGNDIAFGVATKSFGGA